jgi:hypothetical protein
MPLFYSERQGREKPWILSFGPKAKTFSFKFLREKIKEDISRSIAFSRSEPE